MSAEIFEAEDDVIYLHYVNQQNVESCPQVNFLIGAHPYSAVLDTGCEASIMSKRLYSELKSKGIESLELPTQNLVLVGAFSGKEQRVKKQVYLTLKFGDVLIDQIFLVSEQLLTPMLIGHDFCVTNGVILDFQKGKLILQNDGDSVEVKFMNRQDVATVLTGRYRSVNNREVITLPTPLSDPCQLEMVEPPQSLNFSSSEVCPSFYEPDELCKEGNAGTFCSTCPSSEGADAVANCGNRGCEMNDVKASLNECNSVACSNEDLVAEENYDVKVLSVSTKDRVAGNELKGQYDTKQDAKSEAVKPDGKEVNSNLVIQSINMENSLSASQKENLLTLILKYRDHFSKKPGKCNCFEYSYHLQGGTPKSRNSRPIPFVLRREVQEQIEEMLADNIIEESYSSYVNPLTLVHREGKRVRICVDAREVNKFMVHAPVRRTVYNYQNNTAVHV